MDFAEEISSLASRVEEQMDHLETEEATKNAVITTEDEMEGFRVVRAIMREVVDVDRVAPRDVKTYFGVLLDDNNRQPICRLHFNTSQWYLGVFDEDKNEERIPIDTIDEIYDHADKLRRTVRFYDS